MYFKGLSVSRIFHVLNFWTSAISAAAARLCMIQLGRRSWSLGQKGFDPKDGDGQTHACCCLAPLFSPNVPNSFLCPSDPSSYVCWTLLWLIKHFMLTWHFLHGGSCDTFLAGPFSCLSSLQVDIRPETFWQGLLAGQFTWPAKTVPVSCQDFWTWSWSYRDHSFQTPSVSSFDKDEALSRTNEGFYLQCTAVDNTICRVLA